MLRLRKSWQVKKKFIPKAKKTNQRPKPLKEISLLRTKL